MCHFGNICSQVVLRWIAMYGLKDSFIHERVSTATLSNRKGGFSKKGTCTNSRNSAHPFRPRGRLSRANRMMSFPSTHINSRMIESTVFDENITTRFPIALQSHFLANRKPTMGW